MTRNHILSRRPDRKGRVAIILISLVAVAVTGWILWRRFGGGNELGSSDVPLTTVVSKGPFDHIVLEQGEIESSSNIDVVNEVKSRGSSGMTILWVVPEGAYVKTGDKLVELDSSALQDELTAQRIKVLGAEALVISSEATVSTNEIALQEYLEGTYQSERRTILSEIDVAEQTLRKAELNLDSARRLAAKGMLKGLQIEAEAFSVSNARNVLESAQGKLRVLDELTREKNRVQLASNIEASKAKLSSDRNVLAEELAKQREIEELIKKCTIFSPADGIVVYNNERGRGGSMDFMVKEGAVVRERQIILRLPDPSKMQVKALVNESRIVRIQPGMAAKVRVSAYPNEMLARVKRVNKYAEPGSWFSSAVKEYAAYLEIIDPPEAIRTGMSAEVRIFVEQLPEAVQIPVHGVYEYRDHLFCLVKKGENQWETREIKIGATNEQTVTITEGLAEGEEVALNPRSFQSLMQLPEIDIVDDRDSVKNLAGQPMPVDASEQAAAERAGGYRGGRGPREGIANGNAVGGNPGGGRPGSGEFTGAGRPDAVGGAPGAAKGSGRGGEFDGRRFGSEVAGRGGPKADSLDTSDVPSKENVTGDSKENAGEEKSSASGPEQVDSSTKSNTQADGEKSREASSDK